MSQSPSPLSQSNLSWNTIKQCGYLFILDSALSLDIKTDFSLAPYLFRTHNPRDTNNTKGELEQLINYGKREKWKRMIVVVLFYLHICCLASWRKISKRSSVAEWYVIHLNKNNRNMLSGFHGRRWQRWTCNGIWLQIFIIYCYNLLYINWGASFKHLSRNIL